MLTAYIFPFIIPIAIFTFYFTITHPKNICITFYPYIGYISFLADLYYFSSLYIRHSVTKENSCYCEKFYIIVNLLIINQPNYLPITHTVSLQSAQRPPCLPEDIYAFSKVF